uniref:Lipoprotein n=1 Tax=Gracilinema caldarium TaxID=215591 RepID=A0A7C3IP75_9SPIR
MIKGLQKSIILFAVITFSSLAACTKAETADFKLIDQAGKEYALSTAKDGKAGILREGSRFVYQLDRTLEPGPAYALSVTYTVQLEGKGSAGAALNAGSLLVTLLQDAKKTEGGQVRWQLPLSYAFLGFAEPGPVFKIRYAIPLRNQSFSAIVLDYKKGTKNSSTPGTVTLEAIRLESLWFGFSFQDGALSCTPFVGFDSTAYSINVPDQYRSAGPWQLDLSAASIASPVSFRIGAAGSGGYALVSSTIHPLVAGVLPEHPFPVSLSAQNPYNRLVLRRLTLPALPAFPIPADPALILDYRQELWRNPDYEVFQWDRFPKILIFDTRSYEVQDRLFKRLAFYVEKAGFRGRLASDAEIAPLHGWNAHDYLSKDLAEFFTTAEKTQFPLNREERELRDILLSSGIIQASTEDGKKVYVPGDGAIISISRESEAYLRSLFMVHEAFHGLFFIDPDFQAFALDRWTHLDPVAKKFLVAYFQNRGYDTADPYLMKNELMAYCLQQRVSGAALYFGKTLPERLSAFPQHLKSIPEKDEKSGTWPALASLFTAEAQAFSDYVAKRWGLEAGRVWDIKKTSL